MNLNRISNVGLGDVKRMPLLQDAKFHANHWDLKMEHLRMQHWGQRSSELLHRLVARIEELESQQNKGA